MVRSIGYIRVSTQEQAREGISLEMQAHKITQYARLHEMHLIEIIRDEGISAKSIEARPGVLRALDMVSSRQVESVIVFKLDRLARNTRQALEIAELMRKKEVALHSITEKLDTDSAIGEFFFTLMASLCKWNANSPANESGLLWKGKESVVKKLGVSRPTGTVR